MSHAKHKIIKLETPTFKHLATPSLYSLPHCWLRACIDHKILIKKTGALWSNSKEVQFCNYLLVTYKTESNISQFLVRLQNHFLLYMVYYKEFV